jgi:hypothetical protein
VKYFEDFTVGQVDRYDETYLVTEAEIREMGERWDPQPSPTWSSCSTSTTNWSSRSRTPHCSSAAPRSAAPLPDPPRRRRTGRPSRPTGTPRPRRPPPARPDRWASLGWEAGHLGHPLSDERGAPDHRASTFEHRTISWTHRAAPSRRGTSTDSVTCHRHSSDTRGPAGRRRGGC